MSTDCPRTFHAKCEQSGNAAFIFLQGGMHHFALSAALLMHTYMHVYLRLCMCR